jgi:phosphoserine phosphatase
MPDKQRIIIFDFDGTIIANNSFHFFTIFLLIIKTLSLDLNNVLSIIRAILARKRKKISHLDLKKHINEVGYSLNESFIKLFIIILKLSIRPSVLQRLIENSLADDTIIVIASAAPYAYMRKISDIFKVDLVVSYADPQNITPIIEDNTGTNKLINIANRLNQNLTYIEEMYTDHIDDLPLVCIAKKSYIVKPNTDFLNTLIKKEISYQLII